jgi:APA family basic amino acid/polyamine antiporter
VFSGFAILVCLPGKADFLGNVYSFGALMSFTLAHASVIRLRIKYPDFERQYRGPGNIRVRGYDLPLFAIAGGTFTAIAFVVIVALHPSVAIVCVGWLMIGTLIYMAFRRRHGLDLTSTYKVAIPQPVVDHEAEYHSVLVPLSEGYDEHVMATASKLAARRSRGIHVLALVTVPNSLPIDARMEAEEAAANTLIEQAKVQGGRRVSGHMEKVRAGQAGRRIVEEAADMHAAAIVMPLPRRVDGASLFGKTLETVLNERPCRVVIESQPDSGERRKRQVALQESLA